MASKESNIVLYVNRFNHNLKILTRDLTKQCPNDAVIFRTSKRVMTVIAIDPLIALKAVGYYLYQYRTQIYNLENDLENDDSELFFLENSYDADLKAGVDTENVDLVDLIIPKMKDCVRSLSLQDKKSYKLLIINLLDDYIEYLTMSKE